MPLEHIIRAAIRLPDGTLYSLPRPARHYQILDDMGVACCPLAVQGFLTSEGRFVCRKEARVVAEQAGQIQEGACKSEWLYSEDLW